MMKNMKIGCVFLLLAIVTGCGGGGSSSGGGMTDQEAIKQFNASARARGEGPTGLESLED